MTSFLPQSHQKQVANKRAAIAWMREVVKRYPHRQYELDDMISSAITLDPRAFRGEAKNEG